MTRFILRKVFYGILVLLGVVTLVFFLQNKMGGNPALLLGGNSATPELIESIEKELGLDLPLHQRYLLYLNDISPISIVSDNPESRVYNDTASVMMNFGESSLAIKSPYLRKSYQYDRNVSDLIWEHLPDTIILAVAAILIAFIIGVSFGVISASYKGTFFDESLFVIAVTGMSAPSFFVAAIASNVFGFVWAEESQLPTFPLVLMLFAIFVGIIYFFTVGKKKKEEEAEKLNLKRIAVWGLKGFLAGLGIWLIFIIFSSIFGLENLPLISDTITGPGTGLEPTGQLVNSDLYTDEEYYNWNSLILPAITLGIRPLALITQLTRSSMLDVLSEDYIRTARAKGLNEFTIIRKHALKNALSPVITATSGSFASLLAGSVFVEHIFDWKGIGSLLLEAINNSDLPLIIGLTIVIATFFIVINILVDIIYGYLDPRIRIK